MTRLYISADLEGLCGVVSPHHCSPEPDRAAYDWAISQMDLEVGAVVEAALDHGVSHILVNDSHCTMTNLTLEQLDPRVSLLSGKPKRCAMSAGLDESFDAAIYIGYHAKAGAHKGVLSHTFHGKLFDVSINGVSYGEGGINALYASLEYGVPLILASGDKAFIEEMTPLLPELITVETKEGLGQTAAKNHPQDKVLEDYAEKTRLVLENRANWGKNKLALPGPYELKMTFINPLVTDAAHMIPNLERVDGRTLLYKTDSFRSVYQMLQSCYSILAFTNYLE
jgi:D-amino peptidase